MAVSYPIALNVSDPNNNIGLLKIRQADEETQTLVVQVLEDAIPKSYEGLQVFFCAKIGQTDGLGIIEQKLHEAEMTDPENGKLEYTMRAQDWQILGRQLAYFSFRKMTDDHTFVQQFTTRDFSYEVTKSVFSDGTRQIISDGSTYIWTIEDLKRLYEEYIASGKSDWEEFVNLNKEIIESVDPGGQVLSELIRSRKPEGFDVAFPDLPTRLDQQIGKNTDFRPFETDNSFMSRVFNEMKERSVNVKWFGAVGDGITDDSKAFQDAIDYVNSIDYVYRDEDMSLYAGGSVEIKIPYGKYVINKSLTNFPRNLIISGENSVIVSTDPLAEKTFYFTDRMGWKSRITGIKFIKLKNPIYYDVANVEGGRTDITYCEFIDCKGEAIHLSKQSQMAVIEYNLFHKCEVVLHNILTDELHFRNNWVSESNRTPEMSLESIINNGGSMYSIGNLFVPYKQTDVSLETAYFANYGNFISDGDRFGGEAGSKTVVNNYAFARTPNARAVVVKNSPNIHVVHDYTVVRLFKLPNLIDVRGNVGLSDNTVMIKWSKTAQQETEINNITGAMRCMINVYPNISTQTDGTIKFLPDNLRKFLINQTYMTHYRPTLKEKNGSVLTNQVVFNTGKSTLSDLRSITYVLDLDIQTNGSDYYSTRILALVTVSGEYSSSSVRRKINVNVIANNNGGSDPSSAVTLTGLFDSNSSNYIDPAFTDTSGIKLRFSVGGKTASAIRYKIKELMEGQLL